MDIRGFVGLDLGQRQDFTALAVLERVESKGAWDAWQMAWKKVVTLRLRHLERVALGTSYPGIVERVRQVVQSRALSEQCQLWSSRWRWPAGVWKRPGVCAPMSSCDPSRHAPYCSVPAGVTFTRISDISSPAGKLRYGRASNQVLPQGGLLLSPIPRLSRFHRSPPPDRSGSLTAVVDATGVGCPVVDLLQRSPWTARDALVSLPETWPVICSAKRNTMMKPAAAL